VANIIGANHEYDLLGHIRRVIGDAFKIFGHPNHSQSGGHLFRMPRHELCHRSNRGRTKRVDGVVAAEHMRGAPVVPTHEGVERSVKHIAGRHRHRRKLMAYQLFRAAVLFDGALANIDRLVANPFEVRYEPKGRREKTKIVGHGLSQR